MAEGSDHSLRLRRNWSFLLESVNAEDIVPYLIEDLVLDNDMVDEIDAEKTRKSKTKTLLKKLTRSDRRAYESFRRALHRFDVYGHLIERLDSTDVTDSAKVILQPSEDLPDHPGVSPRSRHQSDPFVSFDPGEEASDQLTRQMQRMSMEGASALQTEFTDADCLYLAQLLSPDTDLRMLGLQFGLKEAALSRYAMENRMTGGYEGTYKMLIDWKKMYIDEEQRVVLFNALQRAGLVQLAIQVRCGHALELFSPMPAEVPEDIFFSNPSLSATSPAALCSLASSSEQSQSSKPRPLRGLSVLRTEGVPSSDDVTDLELFELSDHLSIRTYQKLGLKLQFTLNQLDAFKTASTNVVSQAGLEMLREFRSKVGHIRRNEFRDILTDTAPSLAKYVKEPGTS